MDKKRIKRNSLSYRQAKLQKWSYVTALLTKTWQKLSKSCLLYRPWFEFDKTNFLRAPPPWEKRQKKTVFVHLYRYDLKKTAIFGHFVKK